MFVCVYVFLYVSECDSAETVRLIELKLGMHVTGHRRTNPIDFCKCRLNSFFFFFLTGVKGKILIHYAL